MFASHHENTADELDKGCLEIRHPPLESTESRTSVRHTARSFTSSLDYKAMIIEFRCMEIKNKLNYLWDSLNVPNEDRQEFTSAGYTLSSLAKLQEELARVETLRQKRLETVLQDLKKKLFSLWDRCHVGKTLRKKVDYVIDETSPRAVEVLEVELTNWSLYLNVNAEIIKKIELYNSLFEDMLQFEDKCKEEAHLLNIREASLLQKATEKNRLKMEIREAECQLSILSTDYEKRNKIPFMIDDELLLEYIRKLWKMYEFRKKHEKSKVETPSGVGRAPLRFGRSHRMRPMNGHDRLRTKKLMNALSSSIFPTDQDSENMELATKKIKGKLCLLKKRIDKALFCLPQNKRCPLASLLIRNQIRPSGKDLTCLLDVARKIEDGTLKDLVEEYRMQRVLVQLSIIWDRCLIGNRERNSIIRSLHYESDSSYTEAQIILEDWKAYFADNKNVFQNARCFLSLFNQLSARKRVSSGSTSSRQTNQCRQLTLEMTKLEGELVKLGHRFEKK